MRKRIAEVMIGLGFLAGAGAAGFFAYYMWGLDWGPMGTRGHNLMFVTMLFGTIVVFFVVLFVFAWLATFVDPEMGT